MSKRPWVLLLAVLLACSTERPSAKPTPPAPAASPLAGRPLGELGRLIFTRTTSGVWELDLATGQMRLLFRPEPEGEAWVTAAAVSPNGQTLVLAYAPPPAAGQIQFGYTELYLMPADGSTAPQPFLTRRETNESFFTPSWSADGRFIYYAHLHSPSAADATATQPAYQYRVERVAYPPAPGSGGEREAGPSEVIVENAYWPRLSRDGTRLAYVAVMPEVAENRLWVAQADGSQSQPVAGAAEISTVDAPIFTPDGSAMLFSAPSPTPTSMRPEWEGWLGVRTAWAHNIPSDWWRVTLVDGQTQQLTQIAGTGFYGDFAPDGRHLAFTAANAVMVMDPDGQNLVRLADLPGSGTIAWVAPISAIGPQ